MPDEAIWVSFFDPELILRTLDLKPDDCDVVDFGCGYGTFSLAAALIAGGNVFALDIEPEMVDTTARRAREADLYNVKAILRDFVDRGTGLPDCQTYLFSCVFVLLTGMFHRTPVLVRLHTPGSLPDNLWDSRLKLDAC
jgi:SAM-dependent methyltransferase